MRAGETIGRAVQSIGHFAKFYTLHDRFPARSWTGCIVADPLSSRKNLNPAIHRVAARGLKRPTGEAASYSNRNPA